MATIEYSTDGGVSWNEIDYDDFNITNGLFKGKLAPQLTFEVARDEGISGNDLVKVSFSSTVRFEGKAKSGGNWRANGMKEYTVNGNGHDIMDEEISLSLTSVSPETVIDNALPSAFSRSTSTNTGVTLDYEKDTTRRTVIEDMLHRTGYVAWMDSVNKTLYFNPIGERGTYATWTAGTDPVAVPSFEGDDRSTLRNKIIIHGTKDGSDIKVTVSDVKSEYEEHTEEYNFDFVDNETDATKIAENILIAEPYSTGKIVVGGSEFTTENLCNYEIVISDPSKSDVGSTNMLVEEQKIEDQRMTLRVGRGVQFGREKENLDVKSEKEKNEAGATNNQVFFTTDHTTLSNMTEGDMAIEDVDGDGDYDKIFHYTGSSWEEGATKSEVGATVNADYYISSSASGADYGSLSDIPSPQKGDIAIVDDDSDGDYDNLYTYDGSSWINGGTISEINATKNDIYFTTDITSVSGNSGDIALEDVDGDGDYDKIWHNESGSWKEGATKSEVGATVNVDYYDTSLSNISGETEGDIALIDTDGDGDYDEIYTYDGSSWNLGGDRTQTSTQPHSWLTDKPQDAHHLYHRDEVEQWIDGNMVVDGTLDATKIGTMYLSSAEDARFGTNNTEYIAFTDLFGSDDETRIRPSTGGTCAIGSRVNGSYPFEFIGANDIEVHHSLQVNTNFTSSEKGVAFFGPDNSDDAIAIKTGSETTSEPAIYPQTDEHGLIGDYDWGTNNGKKWLQGHFYFLHTDNFTEHSPPRMENKPDIKEIKNIDWDSLPDYVQRVKGKDGEEIPTDGDGVEIGRMCNYLLNICKEQEKVIESYEDRISKLESKVD